MSFSDKMPLTWGLLLDKYAWVSWGGLVILTAVSMYIHPPVISSISDMTISILNLLNLTVQELILRAFLISYLISIIGKTKENILFAIIISSLLIAIVQKPFSDISLYDNIAWDLFTGVFFGYVYIYTKSITIFMYFPLVTRTGALLPHLTSDEMIIPLCLSLLLYIILSSICMVYRRKLYRNRIQT